MALWEKICSCPAAAVQRASFGAGDSQTVRGMARLPSDLDLQRLGCPLLPVAGCPALLLDIATLGEERAERKVACTAATYRSLQIDLQWWVMLLLPAADCSRAGTSGKGRVGGRDNGAVARFAQALLYQMTPQHVPASTEYGHSLKSCLGWIGPGVDS